MLVRVVAFAGLRELLQAEAVLELEEGARLQEAWNALEGRHPGLVAERASTRIAVNGRIADERVVLREGDELALLPPVGGG